MTIKMSTGLKNAGLGTASLKDNLANGFIDVYYCTPVNIPLTADAALSSVHTKLMRVYGDAISAGLNLGVPSGGAIGKDPSETWGGPVLVDGNAVFFRWVMPGDTGDLSTTAIRMQGLCGVGGAELNLSSLALVAGTTRQVNFASISQPG